MKAGYPAILISRINKKNNGKDVMVQSSLPTTSWIMIIPTGNISRPINFYGSAMFLNTAL